MRDATPMPIDKFGNPVPVFVPDTGQTEVVALTAAGTVYAQTSTFAKEVKTYAKYVNNSTTNSGLTITSKLDGDRKISITINSAAGSASISVSGMDISITPKTGELTAKNIADLVNAHVSASSLVTATYNGTGAVNINPTTLTKTYLNGWDPGKVPTIVRVLLTNAGFIGTWPESSNATPTASMPVVENIPIDIAVLPGDIICGKSTAGNGTMYLTPGRKV